MCSRRHPAGPFCPKHGQLPMLRKLGLGALILILLRFAGGRNIIKWRQVFGHVAPCVLVGGKVSVRVGGAFASWNRLLTVFSPTYIHVTISILDISVEATTVPQTDLR